MRERRLDQIEHFLTKMRNLRKNKQLTTMEVSSSQPQPEDQKKHQQVKNTTKAVSRYLMFRCN